MCEVAERERETHPSRGNEKFCSFISLILSVPERVRIQYNSQTKAGSDVLLNRELDPLSYSRRCLVRRKPEEVGQALIPGKQAPY